MTIKYLVSMPKKIIIVVDTILSLSISVPLTLCIGFLRLLKIFPIRYKKKNRLVFFTVFHQTYKASAKGKKPESLYSMFKTPEDMTKMVVCFGDDNTPLLRLKKRLLFLDILIPKFDFLKKHLPRTVINIRDTYAFLLSINLLLKIKPVIIESFSPHTHNWRVMLLRWIFDIKLATEVRGNLDLIIYDQKEKKSLFKRICQPDHIRNKIVSYMFFKTCDLVIGYNINNMQSAISNGAHPSKTFLSRIKNSIDEVSNAYTPREHLDSFPQDGKILTLWSRFSPEKRVIQALEDIIPLLKQRSDVHFVLIGSGPDMAILQDLVTKNDVTRQVHFPGWQLPLYIHSAALHSDVIIVPYGGSSLIEAGLLARPVVAYDIEWHSEVVQHRQTGWLASMHFPDELSLCVAEALDNPAVAKEYGNNLQQLVSTMFNSGCIEKKEEKIFSSFINKSIF